MKRTLFLITVTMAMLLLSGSAYSLDPYTIEIHSEKDSILAGQSIMYTATVTSNLNRTDKVELSVDGFSQTSWVTLNEYEKTLEPKKSATFTFYISPPLDTDVNKYKFRLTASSKSNEKESVTKEINMYVIELSKLEISTLATDRESYLIGQKVSVTSGIKNLGTGRSKNATLILKVTGATTREYSVPVPRLEVDDEYLSNTELEIDRFTDKGPYTVTATLLDDSGNTIKTRNETFEIEKRFIVDKKRRESSTIIEKTIAIQATNNGNERGTAEIREEKSLVPQILEFVTAPQEQTEAGKTTYVWTCELEPGESCTVEYRVKFWIYFVSGILIIAIIFIMVNIIEKPHIRKKYRKGTVHTISIDVKNNSSRPLEDVQVQDMIPTIFNIIESDSTIKPAMAKRKKNGVLLVWKLGKLLPKDERIISYKIKPMLDVEGDIKLPPAKIIGKDKNGVKHIGISRPEKAD